MEKLLQRLRKLKGKSLGGGGSATFDKKSIEIQEGKKGKQKWRARHSPNDHRPITRADRERGGGEKKSNTRRDIKKKKKNDERKKKTPSESRKKKYIYTSRKILKKGSSKKGQEEWAEEGKGLRTKGQGSEKGKKTDRNRVWVWGWGLGETYPEHRRMEGCHPGTPRHQGDVKQTH